MSDCVTYTLTEQEIFTALWHTRRSTTRLLVQTAVLLVFGVSALLALIQGSRDNVAWLCGTVFPLLAVAQWVWPLWEFRREARETAQKNTALTLTFCEETLAVAEQTVAWCNAEFRRVKDCVLWRIDRQWIVIPHRAVCEEVWIKLTEEAAK